MGVKMAFCCFGMGEPRLHYVCTHTHIHIHTHPLPTNKRKRAPAVVGEEEGEGAGLDEGVDALHLLLDARGRRLGLEHLVLVGLVSVGVAMWLVG